MAREFRKKEAAVKAAKKARKTRKNVKVTVKKTYIVSKGTPKKKKSKKK